MFLRNDHINFCEHLGSHYAGFEIICYPVEEGSAEWAWQMLKQNYILVGAYWGDDVIVSPGGQLDCEVIPIKAFGKRRGMPITEQDFISHAETNGWQIYKEPKPVPKPLLADAQVGDLCKTDLDEWIQIDNAPEPPSPGLYHLDRPFKGNIIHTEPLAPEGSAEWALQMWKLGNDIRNETGVVLMADYESEEIRVKRLVDVFPSGWQLYEPKPEQQNPMPTTEFVDLSDAPAGWICKTRDGGNYPLKYIEVSPTRYAYEDKSGLTVYVMANGRYKKNGTDGRDIIACEPEPAKEQFEVGDWVEVTARENIYQDKITFSGVEFGKPHVLARKTKTLKFNPYTGKCFDEKLCVQITRKLSPSEVIVKIGCLSGTVEKSSLFHKIGFILVTEAGNCWISFDALDTQTRGLVDSLLKAREEECQ